MYPAARCCWRLRSTAAAFSALCSQKKKRKSQTLSVMPFLSPGFIMAKKDEEKINRRNSIKNGFHKPLINPTNGKLMIEDSPSPNSGHEQDLITFRSEGEALIQIQEKDPKNLEAISLFVQRHKNMSLPPWKNSNYCLRLCDLDGTDYMGQDYMQEAWEDLYLPKKTKMQVFGTLEYTQDVLHSVPCVILVGEDGCIYAYREEELQLIAKSLKEFVENGKSKVYKRYYYPDSSEEEDKSPPQDEEILKIRQRGRDFVNKGAPKFGAFLNSLPPRRESIKN